MVTPLMLVKNQYFLVFCSDHSVVPQSVLGTGKVLTPEQITADHNSRSTFSCFAMDSGHVSVIFFKPSV
jgi:hypothetical protein